MKQVIFIALSAIIAYGLGMISVGQLIAKAYGRHDLRKTGSGNTGTTNVLRTLGWLPSIMTLVGDALKGVIAAWIGRKLGGETGMLVAGLFAVLGHDFPVISHFRGGKGMATSLGVTCIICPWVAPCLLGIVVIAVIITHTMSIGSLIATTAYPVLTWFLMPEGATKWMYMTFAVILMLLGFICHRSNISRLSKGKENVLDFQKIDKVSHKYNIFKRHKD